MSGLTHRVCHSHIQLFLPVLTQEVINLTVSLTVLYINIFHGFDYVTKEM